jgi:hypothetical protein
MDYPNKKQKLDDQKEGEEVKIVILDAKEDHEKDLDDLINTKVRFDNDTNTITFYKGITWNHH